MSRNEEARRSILGAIRRSLAESAPHDVVHAQRHQAPTPGDRARQLPVLTRSPAAQPAGDASAMPGERNEPASRVEWFRARLEAVAGTLTIARGTDEVVGAIARILEATGARRVAASDSARVQPLVEQACGRIGAELLLDPPAAAQFDCDAGVSTAQWGIAETGTLVLESGQERHRFVSLIPRIHIALLRSDHVCDTLGEALQRAREGAVEGEVPSAAITLVTGPSRTSDIELTLAIGVHGPQELHVIMMEPPPREGPTINPAATDPDQETST